MKNNLIVYENDWILERIYEVSDRIRDKLVDQTLFEERCIKRVSGYLSICETNKRNRRYIERLINEVASAVIERNRNEHTSLFSALIITEGDEGEEVEFEPQDVLANVEEEVLAKETATLLAQDDCRDKMILRYWLIGNTNSAYISRSLARTFGGNDKSHRVYVHRFRESCRKHLETAI